MSSPFRNLLRGQGLAVSVILLGLAAGVLPRSLALSAESSNAYLARAQPATMQGRPQEPFPSGDTGMTREMQRKQRKQLLKSRFEEMKAKADELAALAKSLQEDVDKSNENVLSLKIVEKAEKIEKLAKKIKNAAKGF